MPIIKIISPTAQTYNIQGFGIPAEFEPGEYYNVPDHVARGMMDPTRNWARLATHDDEIPATLPQTLTTPPEAAQSANPPVPPASNPTGGQPAEPTDHPASPAGRRSRR